MQEGGEQRPGAGDATTPAGEEADDEAEDEHGRRPRLQLLGERGIARSGREAGSINPLINLLMPKLLITSTINCLPFICLVSSSSNLSIPLRTIKQVLVPISIRKLLVILHFSKT